MDEDGETTNTANIAAASHLPLPCRPPAHRSVSLIHTSRANTPQPDPVPAVSAVTGRKQYKGRIPVSNRVNLGSTISSSIPPNPGKTGSSGESSNAEKWFQRSNNNVRTGSADLMDSKTITPSILSQYLRDLMENANEEQDDPPFFLRNSSSTETSPGMQVRESADQKDFEPLPHRPGLFQLGTAASSSEDFRSVIDDLTVRNKKLKRKLRKYEKLQDAHLRRDKLFEIRVHALPPHKKRELEETLRKFAMGLEGAPQTGSLGTQSEKHNSRDSTKHSFVPPTMAQQLTASSSMADSAYASASGQHSSVQTGQRSSSHSAMRRPSGKPANNAMSSAQQRDIQTYLSDIPQGLLPKPVVMTEKSKKKLVVKRLEQIFAGKGASLGGHQQPIQQEEISQSAARAERNAREANGRFARGEGAREARIMGSGERHSTEAPLIELEDHEMKGIPPPKASASDVGNADFAIQLGAGENSPDQRPTRPLDLDPERAQVPEENIEYLRHLGFSPTQAGSEEQLVDGRGYMYLNVLINMAQLHTLNVTPEFVKESLEQYSKMLEMSQDGRKVRWKGGSDLTRTSSSGSPGDNSKGSGVPLSQQNGLLAASSSEEMSKLGKALKEQENKLAYAPLFFHQDEGNDDSDDMSEWSSPAEQEPAAADSSGLTSSGMRTSFSKKRQANDGPIIFYNRAPFVTDLSGDWRGASVKATNIQDYTSYPIHAVGIPPTPGSLQRVESRGPLSRQQMSIVDSDTMSTDEFVSSDSVHGFSKPASMSAAGSSSDDSPDPMEFEASGVGGVHPSDNFALNVKSRHTIARGPDPSVHAKTYPPHIRAILATGAASFSSSSSKVAQRSATKAEILMSKRKDLPPSKLPPPSYFQMSSPEDEDEYSDSDDEDEDESEISDDALFSDQPLPSTAPHIVKWPAPHGPETETEYDSDIESNDQDNGNDSEDFDDRSVDMLAHARKVNPELIRLADREYNSALAERLAEDIPAGSSAAAAAGGSGFNSPNTPNRTDVDATGQPTLGRTSVGKELENKSQQQRGILKRNRTSGDGNISMQQQATKSPKLERTSPMM
jgi:hypothetical protein